MAELYQQGISTLKVPQVQPDELDSGSNAMEIAAFKNRRMKRRPTLTRQYQAIAQQRRLRRLSMGQPPALHHQVHAKSTHVSSQMKTSAHQQEPGVLPAQQQQQQQNAGDEFNVTPLYKLESMKSAHAYEAHTINWKEDQEEREMKKRQQKVLRSAGTLRKHIYDLTESIIFNAFILVVILLNTAILCALTFNIVAVRAGTCFIFDQFCF